jgi:hypothetical protein
LHALQGLALSPAASGGCHPPLPQGNGTASSPFIAASLIQDRIKAANPKTIILSGGPNSVHLEGAPRVPNGFFEYCEEKDIPVLGICYGMQVGLAACRAGLGWAGLAGMGRRWTAWQAAAAAGRVTVAHTDVHF